MFVKAVPNGLMVRAGITCREYFLPYNIAANDNMAANWQIPIRLEAVRTTNTKPCHRFLPAQPQLWTQEGLYPSTPLIDKRYSFFYIRNAAII